MYIIESLLDIVAVRSSKNFKSAMRGATRRTRSGKIKIDTSKHRNISIV